MMKWFKKLGIYGILCAAILTAYYDTFAVSFLFDDIYSILNNPYIDQWWPISKAFSVPFETTVGSRPFLNFTFKLNYLISGFHVGSYHVVNLSIHMLNACLIAWILQQTFAKKIFNPEIQKARKYLALGISLIWAVHPLQTNAVTYIVQRAESMAVMFYLLGVASFLFYLRNEQTRWKYFCIVSAILGVMTKEICATLPVFLFLYDWIFVENHWREILQKRGNFYLGVAASWIVLLFVIYGGHRVKMVGESTSYMSGFQYLLYQFGVLTHYLKLIIWPSPLIFDYKWPATISWPWYGVNIFFIGGLFAAGVAGLKFWPKIAFAILGFFIILAPSSSIVPLPAVLAAEYRVYLPMIFILVIVVLGIFQFLNQFKTFIEENKIHVSQIVLGFCVFWSGILWIATIDRNADYKNRLSLWEDTIEKQPLNPRAYNAIADEYRSQKDYRMVEKIFRQGLARIPDDYDLLNNFGGFLAEGGRSEDAMPYLEKALRINPSRIQTYVNIGNIHLERKEFEEAKKYYAQALEKEPNHFLSWGVWVNLASLYIHEKDFKRAENAIFKAAEIKPNHPKVISLMRVIQQQAKKGI